jgi:hypothetical protein
VLVLDRTRQVYCGPAVEFRSDLEKTFPKDKGMHSTSFRFKIVGSLFDEGIARNVRVFGLKGNEACEFSFAKPARWAQFPAKKPSSKN